MSSTALNGWSFKAMNSITFFVIPFASALSFANFLHSLQTAILFSLSNTLQYLHTADILPKAPGHRVTARYYRVTHHYSALLLTPPKAECGFYGNIQPNIFGYWIFSASLLTKQIVDFKPTLLQTYHCWVNMSLSVHVRDSFRKRLPMTPIVCLWYYSKCKGFHQWAKSSIFTV